MTPRHVRRLCGMDVTELPDGTLSAVRVDGPFMAGGASCVGCIVILFGAIWFVGSLKIIPWLHFTAGRHSHQEVEPPPWYVGGAILALGMRVLWGGLEGMFAKVEWLASENSLVQQSTLLGIRRRTAWRDRYLLFISSGLYVAKSQWSMFALLSEGTRSELTEFASLLAQHTAWELKGELPGAGGSPAGPPSN